MKHPLNQPNSAGVQKWNIANFKLLLQYLVFATLITFCVEFLSRHSIIDGIGFLFRRPVAFLYNVVLVWFTLCFALLFARRDFVLSIVSGLWIGIAVANAILLQFRSMPLTASDIWLLSSVRDIFEKYLSPIALIFLMLGISALAGLIFLLWMITKKRESIFVFGLVHFVALGMILFAFTVGFSHFNWLDETAEFDSLPTAYDRNGFSYCFAASLVTGGVEEPEDYSPDEVEQIVDKQTVELPDSAAQTPNIVFVQLESFFDPSYMKDLQFAYDPIPNFRALKGNWPHGLLSVPCIGAGTANTEFEVLTGMNLSHFGVGEYPYMTIVDSSTSESLASVLGQIGYNTHAIHNNNATFYDRHIVYQNLSFDSFTSIEYMNDVEYNPLGWAKDSVLTDEILKCLRADEEKDLVFTVSVQPHGKYPKEPMEGVPTLRVEGMEDTERQAGFEYYLHELSECDRFVGELVNALQGFEEDTVVVFYGDHLPSFNISQEELSHGSNQTTEYVIWANYPLSVVEQELQTYQLSAYVMQLCEIYEGAIFRLHQSYSFRTENDENYQSDLHVLEYDMIYGEKFYSDHEAVEDQTTMRFDVEDIVLHGISLLGEDELLITGENFTAFSAVRINDETFETEYLSDTQLCVREAILEEGDVVCIAQVSAVDDMVILDQSNSMIFSSSVPKN